MPSRDAEFFILSNTQQDHENAAGLDATAQARNRARALAGTAQVQAMQNGNLVRTNEELRAQNQDLQEEVKETNQKLEKVSSLARTKILEADALRKTIDHLRAAWKDSSPNDPAPGKTDETLNETYLGFLRENKLNPQTQAKATDKIESVKGTVPVRKRRSP